MPRNPLFVQPFTLEKGKKKREGKKGPNFCHIKKGEKKKNELGYSFRLTRSKYAAGIRSITIIVNDKTRVQRKERKKNPNFCYIKKEKKKKKEKGARL